MNADLALALQLADAADAITLRYFRSESLEVRTKSDMSPVTEADESAERAMREILARERPGDAVVGEEYGASGAETRRWILDPIDATKNYVRGIPIFATLIALAAGSSLAAGVVSAPALGRRWWAARGEGAFCNGTRIRASKTPTLAESHLSYANVTDWDRYERTDALLALVRSCMRARGFGDFWMHMLVAEGALEIAIEPQVAAWDMAPIQIIVEEAGGRFTDLRGNARFDGGSGLSTNGHVHDAVLEHFR